MQFVPEQGGRRSCTVIAAQWSKIGFRYDGKHVPIESDKKEQVIGGWLEGTGTLFGMAVKISGEVNKRQTCGCQHVRI